MQKWWPRSLVAIALVVGCKSPNEEFCCLTASECEAHGVSGETRPCDPGLACKSNACVAASCSTEGCAATAPTCDTATDVCVGCSASSECSRFPDTDVCDTSSGSCVECIVGADCEAERPVCDEGTCRGCYLDSECESGACGSEGRCVAESDIVYVAPNGSNIGTCDHLAPCKGLGFAVSKTTSVRHHIVMAVGTYVDSLYVTTDRTTAPSLVVHGSGSRLDPPPSFETSLITVLDVAIQLRDLEVVGYGVAPSTAIIRATLGPSVIERVKFINSGGFGTNGAVTLRDVSIQNPVSSGVDFAGTLTLERVVISGGVTGVITNTIGSAIDATNLYVSGTSDVAIDLRNAMGVVRFSTVADSGSDAGTGPRAFVCNSTVSVLSSIIWAPGISPRLSIGGLSQGNDCPLTSVIAGPTPVAGASNSDPLFENASAGNYHITSASPARDAVTVGPDVDFENDSRPEGVRFDIGADEAH